MEVSCCNHSVSSRYAVMGGDTVGKYNLSLPHTYCLYKVILLLWWFLEVLAEEHRNATTHSCIVLW